MICYTPMSMGRDGIHPRVLRELVEAVTKTLATIYQKSWLNREVPADREKCWKDARLQARPEDGSGEQQLCQPDLGAGEDHGADHLEPHHMAEAGQARNHVQPSGIYERQVLLD